MREQVTRWLIALVAICLPVIEVAAVEEYGAENAPKILLAYENTAFKNRLVEQLVAELQDTVHLRVVRHNKGELDKERADAYEAVIIVNSGVNSRVRPWVTTWLNKVRDTEKIILLTTYRDRGWEPKYPAGVDSVTSPSKRSVIGDLTEQIAKKVERLVG